MIEQCYQELGLSHGIWHHQFIRVHCHWVKWAVRQPGKIPALTRSPLTSASDVTRQPLIGRPVQSWSGSTWWPIPLSKWVITPVTNGISRVNPLITGVITHLLSGMGHQVGSPCTIQAWGASPSVLCSIETIDPAQPAFQKQGQCHLRQTTLWVTLLLPLVECYGKPPRSLPRRCGVLWCSDHRRSLSQSCHRAPSRGMLRYELQLRCHSVVCGAQQQASFRKDS